MVELIGYLLEILLVVDFGYDHDIHDSWEEFIDIHEQVCLQKTLFETL